MRLTRATMNIPIWIKSEYVTYISNRPPFSRPEGLPLRLWRVGRLFCVPTFRIANIADYRRFYNPFSFISRKHPEHTQTPNRKRIKKGRTSSDSAFSYTLFLLQNLLSALRQIPHGFDYSISPMVFKTVAVSRIPLK